ncbi:MAG: complex I subunit 4 family protein [Solirubrobacterales bacterium]
MSNVILWLPLAFALVALLFPGRGSGWVIALGSAVTLGFAIGITIGFPQDQTALQFVTDIDWIAALGIHYRIGVDGISIVLVLLTAVMWLAAAVWSALDERESPRLYSFMLGLAETATLGAFLADDLILFVLFFDLMLIPFYFLIGSWGVGDRVRATTKMIIYTLIGSLLMLVAAVAAGLLTEPGQIGATVSYAMPDLLEGSLSEGSQKWLFVFFAAAFLIKMPAFLVHGWMPDAYRSCPLPVLALLSGVLSKVGAYGFLAFALPLFPKAAIDFQETMLLIGLISIGYGSALAFTQTSLRLIAGFSSMAQLGFILMGIFSLQTEGSDGAILLMVTHGIVVLAVFAVAAMLHARLGSDDIAVMGGMGRRAPVLTALFLVTTLALLAMPGSPNFIGEFAILYGVFLHNPAWAILASTGVAMAAFYGLRMFQMTMHGDWRAETPAETTDIPSRELSFREGIVLAPVVLLIVVFALRPGVVFEQTEATVKQTIGAVTAPETTETADRRVP